MAYKTLNLKDFVDQLINITWIPEAFMIIALTLLMFMLAFRKEKSKRVFIRMITYIYVLILFLYWHNYSVILPGVKAFSNNAMHGGTERFISEIVWNKLNLGIFSIKIIVICVFLVLFVILLDSLNMKDT